MHKKLPTSTTPTTSAGAGINAGPVHCVENHDGAYRVWRDAGVTQRLLVHVDAHHDLYGGWLDKKNPKERSRINIANFVYAALEEELVRELIWVVPDQTWARPAGRRDIVRALKTLDQGSAPWCWPSELLMQLQARGIHTDLTTIAYSVEGGYSPPPRTACGRTWPLRATTWPTCRRWQGAWSRGVRIFAKR